MENIIEINGVKYIKEQSKEEMKYVIVRSNRAGVFAGYLHTKNIFQWGVL